MCSVRQANNVLLWTNFVRQKDSVLMLNIRFETCFCFVLFCFFFTVAYYKFTILITHIVIIIFENLEDVWSIFLFYGVFFFFFVVVVFLLWIYI